MISRRFWVRFSARLLFFVLEEGVFEKGFSRGYFERDSLAQLIIYFLQNKRRRNERQSKQASDTKNDETSSKNLSVNEVKTNSELATGVDFVFVMGLIYVMVEEWFLQVLRHPAIKGVPY